MSMVVDKKNVNGYKFLKKSHKTLYKTILIVLSDTKLFLMWTFGLSPLFCIILVSKQFILYNFLLLIY